MFNRLPKIISNRGLFLFIFLSLCSFSGVAQVWSDSLQNCFVPTANHRFDFDERILLPVYPQQPPIQYIAVERNTTQQVLFRVQEPSKRNTSRWKFVDEYGKIIPIFALSDSLYSLQIEAIKHQSSIAAMYQKTNLVQLEIIPLEKKKEQIFIVPLGNYKIKASLIQQELERIYGKAAIHFQVNVTPPFSNEKFNSNTQFANPMSEHKRYTQQMRDLRNAYFKTNKNANKKSYYVFIIDGFLDSTLNAYMPTNKAFAFVKYSKEKAFSYTLARELGYGLGSFVPMYLENKLLIGSTKNIMDTTDGYDLNYLQWKTLQQSAHTFQFYDEDEDVRTNNGLVAYYFWEEDEYGWIKMKGKNPLSGIHRPYKKNYRSYHLNIEDYFFKELFKIGGYRISLWHLIGLLLSGILWFFSRKYILRKIETNQQSKRHWQIPIKLTILTTFCLLYYGVFVLLNRQLTHYEIRSGKIKDFNTYSYKQVRNSILYDKELEHENQAVLSSQLIIKRKKDWYVKERKQVLYFSIWENENETFNKLKYSHDSDSLIIFDKEFSALAESHYVVYNYYDKIGNFLEQRVFNHVGLDITQKLLVDDDAKRILLFVNGYRPTSVGKNFEENFFDIRTFGLEHPDSKNLIYDFDRYDYWRPWREIDVLFQNRINPTNTYYADGHHSVSTSNHESLIQFTSNSNTYPKRCSNLKKHHCYTTKIPGRGFFSEEQTKKTTTLLATSPNQKGFNYRRNQGKIAGKNLLMTLNEFPSRAENDTIYLVAHSMGFAYSLGMLDELRGKINFGGFYILAPENGESGKVNLNEWLEIWQYGSNLFGKYPDAPCLQDGVAPQSKVGGLTKDQTVFFSKKLDRSKGYFESHFIGYYTWIFELPPDSKGHIKQR